MRFSSLSAGLLLPIAACVFLTACTQPREVIVLGLPPDEDTSSSAAASASSVSLVPIDCETIPLPATPTETQEMILDGFGTVQVPYNPAWQDEEGETLMSREKTNAGGEFGPYRYVPDFAGTSFRHWKNSACAPSRDFSYFIANGTRQELLQQERDREPPPASLVTVERIGEVDAIVVPAPDAVCPSPTIIVLRTDGGPHYAFTLSCQAVSFYKNPMLELRNIVKSIKLTK